MGDLAKTETENQLDKISTELGNAKIKIEELQAKLANLRVICLRESQILKATLKRKNNKTMIAVVAECLEEQALKGALNNG